MKIKNSFHNKKYDMSKEYYEADKPSEVYKGFLLFNKTLNPWVDVVKEEGEQYVIISQRGSMNNAKEFIDSLGGYENDALQ